MSPPMTTTCTSCCTSKRKNEATHESRKQQLSNKHRGTTRYQQGWKGNARTTSVDGRWTCKHVCAPSWAARVSHADPREFHACHTSVFLCFCFPSFCAFLNLHAWLALVPLPVSLSFAFLFCFALKRPPAHAVPPSAPSHTPLRIPSCPSLVSVMCLASVSFWVLLSTPRLRSRASGFSHELLSLAWTHTRGEAQARQNAAMELSERLQPSPNP